MRARRRVAFWSAAALLVVIVAFGLHRISKARCFAFTGDLICRVETERKLVALTFDDGPTPEGTAYVLRALDQAGAKGTFFLIGEHMAYHPGLARRIAAGGHEVGNHSYVHDRMIFRSPGFYRSEIVRTQAVLRAEGVRTAGLFRPPFGRKLIGLGLAAGQAGHRMIMWDVEEPGDAKSASTYATEIMSRIRPGSIVLIHPMYRHNQMARDALPILLRSLNAQGYRSVTVSELLASPGR